VTPRRRRPGAGALARWYRENGRHALAWRASRDRWAILVSEVMLHQTQVPRVAAAWPAFMARFPTPEAMAAATPGDVITAWDRLGYPRRALRLWESAVVIARGGWPGDLSTLPGVGRYTANAVLAQAEDADLPAIETNVRRVLERVRGERLTPRAAEAAMAEVGAPLRGRDRLLALMDVGAILCLPREPRCGECPLEPACATRGPLPGESRPRQPKFEGSFRQRRGRVMAELRAGPVKASALDPEALASLTADGLAAVTRGTAHLP
jgi:A/G-specific adenine glycosylase